MSETPARKPFIGGNWKCNGTLESVAALVAGLNEAKYPEFVDAVVAPNFLHLSYVKDNLQNGFQVSAQNCSRTGTGAYTGEVSASQITDFGLNWVILGHSERRAYYGDTNEIVGEKVKIAQNEGLSVIACVGESLDDRKADRTMDVVKAQLQPIFDNVVNWESIVIAYEPVWAIGTGVTASPDQAQAVHEQIRSLIPNADVAARTRFIYGGSVKPANCNELWSKSDIDGFLVGGASLKPIDFGTILNAPASKL